MTKQMLKIAVADLLAIPPVLHRTFRKKIMIKTFGDISEKITSVHNEIIWLLEEDGPLSIGNIGDQLMIAKAQMTQLIDKLVELNIVERRAVKGDRRKIEIALTDTGKGLLKEHRKNIDQSVMDLMSNLNEKDLKSLSDSLAAVKDVLSRLK
jgi:DNA-binding MarR family transcriptional regulator